MLFFGYYNDLVLKSMVIMFLVLYFLSLVKTHSNQFRHFKLYKALVTISSTVYKVLFEWHSGQTPGKRAMGIKVVNLNFEKADLKAIL